MKKVVITGATGMIGINLIEYLLEKDIEVLALVRRNSPRNKWLPQNSKIKILECSLDELNTIEIKEKYDVFIHLGWEGPYGENRNNSYLQSKNIQYTLDAVSLAKKIGCKRFVGAGSQAEYGNVKGKISPKTAVHPETGYGIAKFCAGKLSRILANQLEIEHIWVRILSVYGPFDRKETMIMSSIIQMIDNQSSPKYTKAEQMWDYLYVEDMARALYLISEKGKNDAIYCVGSGKQKQLKEYIEEIKNQINPKIELKFGDIAYAPHQVMNLCADITNLTKDTGFIPEIEFAEGIRRTIQWWYKRGKENEKN